MSVGYQPFVVDLSTNACASCVSVVEYQLILD